MLKKIDQMLAENVGNKLTQPLALGMLGNIDQILKEGLKAYRETVRKEFQDELDAKAASAQESTEV